MVNKKYLQIIVKDKDSIIYMLQFFLSFFGILLVAMCIPDNWITVQELTTFEGIMFCLGFFLFLFGISSILTYILLFAFRLEFKLTKKK